VQPAPEFVGELARDGEPFAGALLQRLEANQLQVARDLWVDRAKAGRLFLEDLEEERARTALLPKSVSK
jgi:hypothetical protein